MDKKKNMCSEPKKCKKAKTQLVDGSKCLKQDPTGCADNAPPRLANRIAILDVILSSIQAQQEEWPKEAL